MELVMALLGLQGYGSAGFGYALIRYIIVNRERALKH